MKSRQGSNRAICVGDRARAGIGEPASDRQSILKVMSGWKTPYLKKFITTARSDAWRNAATWLLEQRLGLEKKLQARENTKRKRKLRHVPLN